MVVATHKRALGTLLQSPAALEALGCGLLPALSPLMSQPTGGPGGSRVSQVSNITPGTHARSLFTPPPPMVPPILRVWAT